MKYVFIDAWDDYSIITDIHRELPVNPVFLLFATFLEKAGKEVSFWDASSLEFSRADLYSYLETEKIENLFIFANIDNIHSIIKSSINEHISNNIKITIISLNEDLSFLINNSEFQLIMFDEKKSIVWNLEKFIEKLGLPKENLVLDPFPINYSLHSNLDNKTVIINVGTGCQASCNFCTIAESRIVYKEIYVLMDEIEALLEKGIKFFHIINHNFTFDFNFVNEFCNELLKKTKSYEFGWSCFIVPSFFNTNLLPIMANAGLKKIEIGCESGSEQILNDFKIKHTIKDVESILYETIAAKIPLVSAHIIINSPFETIQTLRETKEFIFKIQSQTYGLCDIYLHHYFPEKEKIIAINDNIIKKRTGYVNRNSNITYPELMISVKEIKEGIKSNIRNLKDSSPFKLQYEHFRIARLFGVKSQFYKCNIDKTYKSLIFERKYLSNIYFSWDIKDSIEIYTPFFLTPDKYQHEELKEDFSNYKIALLSYIIRGMTVGSIIDTISKESNNIITKKLVIQALNEWEEKATLYYKKTL